MATKNTVNLYPVGPPAHDAATPKLGVCLSGGGSRALSAGLGALSGLTGTQDPGDSSQSLMDRVDYISSVSGGTWCAVVYTFTPGKLNGAPVTDQDLLISPQPPEALRKIGRHRAQAANVDYLNPFCIGTAPQQFNLIKIVEFLRTLYKWRLFKNEDKWRWFWISAVGEIVLKRFGLYDAAYPRDQDFIEPALFFSESDDYISRKITQDNPALTPDQFHTVRPNRKPLFVNFNLLENLRHPDPVQIPVQATAQATGILGQSPDGSIQGGGSVESFGFTSTLDGAGSQAGTAAATLHRRYGLCDIAGCSSAFFAEALLALVDRKLEAIKNEIAGNFVTRFLFRKWIREIDEFVKRGTAAELIPQYNYWTLGSLDDPDNMNRGFSDGGDFDNTGILGLLARTDANRVIAFVNSSTPLTRDAQGNVTLAGQVPLLFGYQPTPKDGKYVKWPNGMSPADPMSYVQVFSDSGDAFAQLLGGLADASAGTAHGPLAQRTAAFTQELTTVDNPVAQIRGGRKITVLWVYNNRVNAWQNAITDPGIKQALEEGQGNQNEDGSKKEGSARGPLANFPWYSTGEQIHLDEEAVNMLAQLSAWNVSQLADEIAKLVTTSAS